MAAQSALQSSPSAGTPLPLEEAGPPRCSRAERRTCASTSLSSSSPGFLLMFEASLHVQTSSLRGHMYYTCFNSALGMAFLLMFEASLHVQ